MKINQEIPPFIVFDGPSGTGKGTLIPLVETALKSYGLNPSIFVEEEADKNRAEILEARNRGKSAGGAGDREMAEILVRHRQELYEKIVVPALLDGQIVLADRGEPATLAYQTVKGELTMNEVWGMHRNQQIRLPDSVVLTLCSPETALHREKQDRTASTLRQQIESGKGLSGKVSSDPAADRETKLKSRRAIHSNYEVAAKFLSDKGIPVLTLDTERMTPDEELSQVVGFLGLTK